VTQWYMKCILVMVMLAALISACASPSSTSIPRRVGTAAPFSRAVLDATTPSDSSTPTATTEAQTLAAAPTLTPEQTSTAATAEAATGTPSPTLNPQQACDDMIARGQPGLYVVSIQPYPDLVWDRENRSFRVDLCNTTTVPTPLESRFVVFVYFPGESRPRGQTSELPIRLPPGLTEITLSSWIPGLQNHISACVVQPPVEFSVAYRYPPDLSVFHPIPYVDGQERETFSVKCGGNFP
jgi:hypothetical protein